MKMYLLKSYNLFGINNGSYSYGNFFSIKVIFVSVSIVSLVILLTPSSFPMSLSILSQKKKKKINHIIEYEFISLKTNKKKINFYIHNLFSHCTVSKNWANPLSLQRGL